ncbi:MAG: 4Fe-4S binding protein [bacterium]|nr:4Fe-4S binding protein [bacterium]
MKNLLKNKTIKDLIKQGLFPGLFQFLTLVVLILILVWTWPNHNIAGISASDPLIYTNLGNLLFWIYWMMGMIILVLLWGRTWCAICPIGMVNGIAGKFGLKLNYPKKLRNWYLLVVVFILLQITINISKLNHYPDLTARLIFIFILLGTIFGLLFRGRVFCRYLCPVGSMIGVYSCFSPLELRVKDKKICAQCLNRECVKGKTNAFSLCLGKTEFPVQNNAIPCPADIFPATLEENTHCYFCGQCVKVCPNDNVRWNTRNIFKEVLLPNERPFSETLFIIVLLGMIMEKFVPMWPGLQEKIFPESLPALIFYIWIYLILPGIIILLPSFLIYFISKIRIKQPDETGQTAEPVSLNKIIAYGSNIFIPVIFFSHFALALVKIFTRGGYIFYGLMDPVGIKTYRAIYQAEIIKAPESILPVFILRWIVLLPVIFGSIISLITVFKLIRSNSFNKNSYAFAIINSVVIFAVSLMFLLIVRNWLFN